MRVLETSHRRKMTLDDAVLRDLCGGLEPISLDVFRDVVALRRELHCNPELANKEHETASKIREALSKFDGVELLFSAGGTGVLALIEGGAPGRTLLFRADMDALPIQETEVARAGVGPAQEGQQVCCAFCGSEGSSLWPPPGKRRKAVGGGRQAAGQPQSAEVFAKPKPAVSQIAGVSHACGHDGHVAMLVGAARLLAANRTELKGRVLLLFQPAEERHSINNPMGGAIRMIRDVQAGRKLAERLGAPARDLSGTRAERATERERNETDGHDESMDGALLDGVDEVYGAHLWNYAPAGTIGCAVGSVTANSDDLQLIVRGTGGHASAPQGTVDALVVASQLVVSLQTIISRNVAPTESAVITLGKIDGGFAPNVIANHVRILGTVRTYTPPVKALLRRRIAEVAAGVAAQHGPRCTIEVKFADGYPACVNDDECADAVLRAARKLVGASLAGPPTPNMAGEDFSFFLSRKRGAFFFIGSNPLSPFATGSSYVEPPEEEHGQKVVIAHHTPEFDIHEGSLAVGVATWVALARQRLG
jgi:amidohydrolase